MRAAAAGRRRAWTRPGVREWARAQGIEVKDRGRVPADLVARFKDAPGRQG
ncbi:MAG TPA: histone-like nucleoid-structuring protein Lsr2 [Streptosporangiaceae bacterium]|nr:histone-like nucleoid-structuring protein Lsr2 [Streptosporangiaceae bacterium]